VNFLVRVKIGVVGVGGIFQYAHLPAYPNVNEAQLVCLCDLSKDALRVSENKLKKVYFDRAMKAEEEENFDLSQQLRDDVKNLKTYTNFAEMLEKEEVELIDICTPTKFHNQIAIDALNQGFNVMVEKPMARTYIECLEVMEAVADNKKFYQHNENWLFQSLWYNARKFIESGRIGELQLIFISQSHGGPEWASWFWDSDIAGGGALLDNGVHAITTAWFLNGFERKPIVVKAVEPCGICIKMQTRILQGMFKSFQVEDDAHILIRFEDNNGVWSTANIEGSWAGKDSMDTAIIGTNGILRPITKNGDVFIEVTDVNGQKSEIKTSGSGSNSSFGGEIKNMCNSIINRTRPLCDENIGAETTAIVQSAYLSQIKGKRPVTIDEFKKYALRIKEEKGKNASNILLKELMKGIKKF
jgi:predicted dehydrogenase